MNKFIDYCKKENFTLKILIRVILLNSPNNNLERNLNKLSL